MLTSPLASESELKRKVGRAQEYYGVVFLWEDSIQRNWILLPRQKLNNQVSVNICFMSNLCDLLYK